MKRALPVTAVFCRKSKIGYIFVCGWQTQIPDIASWLM
jgi:hypothetical protein